MSKAKYPNRDALREANDIYLDAMYQFVSKCLGKVQGTTAKKLITDALRWSSQDDIEEKIEIRDIAYLVRTYWYESFEEQFETIDRHYEARSAIGLIVEGRNRASHRPWDLDSEFTRTQLFLIAELLGKINKPNEHREVKAIRDKLFPNDTKERLLEVEAENAKYQKSLVEAEKHLETAEVEKQEYENNKKELSQQILDNALKIEAISKRLKEAKSENDECKKNLAGTKQHLEKSKAAQADYKERLKTTSKELKDTKNKLAAVEAERTDHKKHLKTISEELESVKVERSTFEERLTATSNELASVRVEQKVSEKYLTVARNLLTTVAIGDQGVFPPFGTDSAVRILDRRGTDKRNYLVALLKQKQPTIVYVQSEEKVDQLLTLVGSEKAEVIAKHSDQTSETEETEILEKLRTGELVAIVSDTTFSTSIPSHCVEHFVFCHLAPSSEAFFERCQPAFTSANNAYLHFIYESKQNVEDLAEKYPNEETLRKLYQKFRDRTSINAEFINPDDLYNELCKENELDITNLGIETGFSIFEELGFLEQNEEGIRRLSTPPRKLEESKIYCRGKKLEEEVANSPAFQHEHSIEQIWEKMLEELNIADEQILREISIHRMGFNISETGSDAPPAIDTEQDKITTSTPEVWPQRGVTAFNDLRQRAARITNDTDAISVRERRISDFSGSLASPFASSAWVKKRREDEVESTLLEDMENEEDYENKYNLAIQFAQEQGVSALEQGIAQLVEDRDNLDYDFTEDETNMLLAFQDALRDFRTQSEQSTEGVGNDSAASGETAEAHSIPKPPRANAKVTEEQVREIRSRSAAGESYSGLAKEFGLTPTGIRNIVLRNTWKHVE